MKAAIGQAVMGGSLTSDEPLLLDAWFLVHHPSWTYQELMATPEAILERMRLIRTAYGSKRRV